jgi:hypothetical protein
VLLVLLLLVLATDRAHSDVNETHPSADCLRGFVCVRA